MTCKNCGHPVQGNYCSACGQRSNVDRINLPNFLSEVSNGVFHVDRGFFYTLRALFIRPGNSIRAFLEGQRKKHFKPIAYVLTLSTFYFLVTRITDQNTWLGDFIYGWNLEEADTNQEAQVPGVVTWLSENYAYATLLLLPVFSLASYLSFRRFGRNYLEHIVLNSYITGQQALTYSLFAFAGSIYPTDVFEGLSVLVAVLYTGWVFWQFFSTGNRILNILRTLLTYLLYLILSTGLLTLVLAVQ